MKDNSLVYNNSLISPENFIDSILYHEPKEQLPTCDIEESPDFYYININSFYDDKHVLEISYKNNFLTLRFMLDDDFQQLLFQRIFYLLKIDLDYILLHEFKDSIKLIIPKIA